jgi:predicted dehydrogenase/nucleoside-diphosphate-sugar epimerase
MVRRRVALLGAGYILESHVRALRQLRDVQIVGVCDSVAARATAAAQRWQIASTFGSINEVIDSGCDVVHVLLPPDQHHDVVEHLLLAGKHVFVEKPIAPGGDQADALERLASRRSLKLGVNHNFLFAPAFERLAADLAARRLGPIDHLAVDWHFSLPQLKSGPFSQWMLRDASHLAYELGPHLAAFVIHLLGVPDRMQVLVGDSIDLPGGGCAYRKWSAIGSVGSATFGLCMSLGAGFPLRRVAVRGLGGVGQVNLDTDIYVSQSRHRPGDPFVTGRAVRDEATQFGVQRRLNLFRRCVGTLRGDSRSNPFLESTARSVGAFYRQFDGETDSRHRPGLATDVMRLCDRLAGPAGAQPARRAGPVPRSSEVSQGQDLVLVVGGTGFIGRHLVQGLADEGRRVRVMTRDAAAAAHVLPPGVELFHGWHGDPEAARRALDGVGVVYHLGKCEGQRWADYVAGDVEPTRVLAEAALHAGVERLVYTGTIDSHFSGSPSITIDSNSALDPRIDHRNHYARSKAACERLLTALQRERKLPLVIARPGVVIGPGSAPAHWGVGMFRSETDVDFWGSGTNLLPLVLVDDVADALLRAGRVPGIEGQALLMTDRPMLSARDYVAELSRALGAHVHARAVPTWKLFALDVLRQAAKAAIGHPNRRRPSYRDWQCRALRANFDNGLTTNLLGWQPCGNKEALVRRGIDAAVKHYLGR